MNAVTDVESTFVALDLDRTLIDNNVLMELVIESLAELGFTDSEVAAISHEEQGSRGRSFDVFGYISAQYPHRGDVLSIHGINQLQKLVLEKNTDGFVFEGAQELLTRLEESRLQYGIVTYGSEIWQRTKISMMCTILNRPLGSLPAMVTSLKNKAELCETQWYRKDTDDFDIPAELNILHETRHVKSVVLVDDKIENFDTTMQHVIRGIQIDNYGPDSQKRLANRIDMIIHAATST